MLSNELIKIGSICIWRQGRGKLLWGIGLRLWSIRGGNLIDGDMNLWYFVIYCLWYLLYGFDGKITMKVIKISAHSNLVFSIGCQVLHPRWGFIPWSLHYLQISNLESWNREIWNFKLHIDRLLSEFLTIRRNNCW